jgi:hypothetical protein
MEGTEQPRLLVHITDRTEISANNLEIGILAHIILGHLKHPEMEICDWAERPTCYKDDRLLLRVAESRRQAVRREGIIGGICELVGFPNYGHDEGENKWTM